MLDIGLYDIPLNKGNNKDMVQAFINKYFFFLFIFTLIFSILLYNFIGFITIEDTTGSTFIAQGGILVMMLLGLILSNMRHEVVEKESSISENIIS